MWYVCMYVYIYIYMRYMLSVDAGAAVENKIQIGWNKFRQLVLLFTNKDISLKVRGRLYSGCVRSSKLHGSETCPVRKENEVALQRLSICDICGSWPRRLKILETNCANSLPSIFALSGTKFIATYSRENMEKFSGENVRSTPTSITSG